MRAITVLVPMVIHQALLTRNLSMALKENKSLTGKTRATLTGSNFQPSAKDLINRAIGLNHGCKT
jgi:hypothetical protein